ncbi:prolipoprotein diacylglyceryl transferase [Hymenobacter sp. 15J16-1T3B]|uniref:prolipoprotein diacylglyceryl transferase family protein n=1 Tax=Hymenobacter sp. 15J16-1T3B TaxID=2886941 RepID=UPI001D1094F8|nr:prolipoprotein diacylglyceryl transferase family protein [Hymenobacter sp. 15J16-1T3B]MCC3160098.1 prolipoprotein diacylglyceryl transferase [Hymenobacter sp. 15J16-1T3B]
MLGAELTKKRLGDTASSGDLMVYPLILGMGLGRTGCLLAGLEDGTYGTASALPWALDLDDGGPRHPTNLFEILFWLLSTYLLFRLLVEFIKPTSPLPGLGLASIQCACVAGLLYYAWLWLTDAARPVAAGASAPIFHPA